AVTLTSAMNVDGSDPGTYTTFVTRGKIPAGTIVDSHLVHSDPPARSTTPGRTGSVTFPTDVIGIVGSTARLAATDSTLGAPGTTYAGSVKYRGLEADSNGRPDTVTISADRRTVSIDFRTTSVIDDLRIITRHVDSLATAITDTPDPVTA